MCRTCRRALWSVSDRRQKEKSQRILLCLSLIHIYNGEIKNISFGLFAAEEIVSASGTSIPANGLVEIISLNEDGTAKDVYKRQGLC